jgi:hypothetical protein
MSVIPLYVVVLVMKTRRKYGFLKDRRRYRQPRGVGRHVPVSLRGRVWK